MKPILALGAATLLLAAAASAAHAEKWFYYPVPGGAMSYDADSRRFDPPSGHVAGDTMVFYHVPKARGAEAYSFYVRRIEFDCLGNTYKESQSAFFDPDGKPLGQTTDDEWMPLKPNTTPFVFKRILCDNERPPSAKEAGSQEVLLSALRALPVTSAIEAPGAPVPATVTTAPANLVKTPAPVIGPVASLPAPAPLLPTRPEPAPVVEQAAADPSSDAILTITPRDRSNDLATPEIDLKGNPINPKSAGPLPMNPILAKIPRDQRGKDSSYGK